MIKTWTKTSFIIESVLRQMNGGTWANCNIDRIKRAEAQWAALIAAGYRPEDASEE